MCVCVYYAVSAIVVWLCMVIKSHNTQNTIILEQFLVLIVVIQILLVKLINASLHKTKRPARTITAVLRIN